MEQKPQNPANAPQKAARDFKRIPMSTPVQKLEVVNIPGFHTHWMRGEPARIQQALRAGYTFVKDEEVLLNSKTIAGNRLDGGNTDLGGNVSIPAGRADERGEPVRLILMKIPLEFYSEDKALEEERQDKIAEALRGGNITNVSGAETAPPGSDPSNRYLPTKGRNSNIFLKRRT